MKTTKTFICTIAALAMMLWAQVPAHAEYLGMLPKDQDWTMEVISSSPDNIAITVYYLGNNLDVIEVMTVPTGAVVQKAFSKPGSRTKRIIIEVDPSPGGRATFSFNGGTPINIDSSGRLVFNVV